MALKRVKGFRCYECAGPIEYVYDDSFGFSPVGAFMHSTSDSFYAGTEITHDARVAPNYDARRLPAGAALVICEHCKFPHDKDDDGTECLYPKTI